MGTRNFSVDDARRFYDRFGQSQDSQGWYEDPATDLLVREANFESADLVVEVGCGTGRFAERLLTYVLGRDSRYRGYELSSTMADLAHERLAGYGSRAAVVLTDGSMVFDELDGNVDRVVANYVLDLVDEEEIYAFLREAHRVLEWDGRLCLVSLTYGNTLVSRAVSSVWSAVRRVRPSLVGGCQPIRLTEYVGEPDWEVTFDQVVVATGVPSEVMVAKPMKARETTEV